MPSPSRSNKVLFWASFFTLIAAGIGFSVRGAILKDWGGQFGFTQGELGTITGGGLIGFGLAIIFFSFFADRFGYGKLMLVAFLLHTLSAVVTFAATPVYQAYGKEGAYWCLYIGMWLFALGNGTCEAVINPLTATLFPDNKTHWLNILHAGWPLGLVLGAGIVLAFGQSATPIRWEIKLGVFLVPVLIYGLLMLGKTFPESEAATAGVSMSESMKSIGLIGFAAAAGLLGVLLQNEIPTMLKPSDGSPAPAWHKFIGWAVAGVIWVVFWVVSKFAIGSLVIAFIYVLHALVGYVELGTDSWITNITTRVLANETNALLAFIWTNVLMCFLRFFAGPIVHKINPVGLLFVSAVLGALGLWLLGQNFTNSVWPWVAAVTVYALGKTFYWPTLLGVISERFPKGGALALGISGGVGMMCAGLIGAPGIGYKQDYFAVKKLKDDGASATYDRYVARDADGNPSTKPFPVLTMADPNTFQPVAGLDGGKLKVFDDFKANLKKVHAAIKADKKADEVPKLLGEKDEVKEFDLTPAIGAEKVKVKAEFVSAETAEKLKKAAKDANKPDPVLATTLQGDLATVAKLKSEGKKVEEKLEKTLTTQKTWWDTEGITSFSADEGKLDESQLVGGKEALKYTAIVPAILAVGFLLLILYFAATGGYKAETLVAPRPYDPGRGVGAPADQWGK